MTSVLRSAVTLRNVLQLTGRRRTGNSNIMLRLMSQNVSSSSSISWKPITKNIQLVSGARSDSEAVSRPLAIIFCWLLAKKRHIMKYGNIYIGQGFDLLAVNVSPMQILFPAKGSQLITEDVLDFLLKKDIYRKIVIHAFSVGAYMFGEMLVKMEKERKYLPIGDRIVGQIYDSASDHSDIATGMPKAITGNLFLQKAMENYIRFHLSAFYNAATRHYLRASEQFHDTHLRSPALFLFSRSDPVATAEGNFKVINVWKQRGIEVRAHCWDRSPHVSHMHHHEDEYTEEMVQFLKSIGLLTAPLDRKKPLSNL